MIELLFAVLGMSVCVLTLMPYVAAHHWGAYRRTPFGEVCERNNHLATVILVAIVLILATAGFLWSAASLIELVRT